MPYMNFALLAGSEAFTVVMKTRPYNVANGMTKSKPLTQRTKRHAIDSQLACAKLEQMYPALRASRDVVVSSGAVADWLILPRMPLIRS